MTTPIVTTLALLESGSATVDASGNATVALGPAKPGEKWHIVATTMTCASMVGTLLRNGVVTSDSFANDTRPQIQSDTVYDLHSGETLTGKWSSGVPGTIVTMTVEGTRTLPGRVAY